MTAQNVEPCQPGVDTRRWRRIGADAEARVMPDDTPIRLDGIDNGLTLAYYRGRLHDPQRRGVITAMIADEGIVVEVYR